TKRRCRRLVNDSVFADRKLTGHDWRGHYSITSSARPSHTRYHHHESSKSDAHKGHCLCFGIGFHEFLLLGDVSIAKDRPGRMRRCIVTHWDPPLTRGGRISNPEFPASVIRIAILMS